jgi:glycosyltransferase involved in cell wall biosynthesis
LSRRICICHLTSVHRATDTRIFYKECCSLAKYYDVTLIASARQNERKDGVQIIRLHSYKRRLLRFLLTDWELFFKALLLNAKLYHFHDPELIPFALMLKLLGKKIIYDVHENVGADLQEKKWLPAKDLFGRLYKILEKAAMKRFHFVLAEQSYEPLYKDKVKSYAIVQNFAATDILKPKTNEVFQSDKMLFVGMLGARRGLPVMMEALHILKSKYKTELKIICIGTVTHEVEHILDSSPFYHSIGGQLVFEGNKPLPEAYKYAEECFAGLALPEDLPNHRESYPTKLFEYMAVGLPVICSDFPLYTAIVGKHNCGMAIPADDAEKLAIIMLYLYEHPEEARQLGRNGTAAVQRYSWQSEEAKLLALYQTMLM